MDKKTLKKNLVEYFSVSEIDDICFELNVDSELVPGKTKIDKVRELILYCERREGLLHQLFIKASSLRPNIVWQSNKTPPLDPQNRATTRILLDDWEEKAYRTPKLIDRLLLKKPFTIKDAVLIALEQYCNTSLKAGLPIEVWSNLSSTWHRIKTVDELWVRLIEISAMRQIGDTKWLIKQTLNTLNQSAHNSRVLQVWESICKSYCFHDSSSFNEGILQRIVRAGIEVAEEKRTQNYSRLYIFFSFIFEQLHDDVLSVRYIADYLESYYSDIVGKSASPSYLERLKRLIGKGRRMTYETIHDLPSFSPALIIIKSEKLNYQFQAMKYPLTNADFVAITTRYPKEEHNLEDPYVFFVDDKAENPFADLFSDAKSIFELCTQFEEDVDYEWDIPTVAEWFALADCERQDFPWGNELPTPERANLDFGIDSVSKLRPVGVHPLGATKYGVHDCCGNVHEVVRLSRSNFSPDKFRLMGGCYKTGYKEAQCTRIRGFARNQVLMRRNVGIRLVRFHRNDYRKRFLSTMPEY